MLVTLMSFSVVAQESKLVPIEEYEPWGIPMGDSFTGFMTCEVIDLVVVDLKDGKTTKYSSVKDSFKVGDKMVLKVQYNTSGLVPQFVIEQTKEVPHFYKIYELLYATDEYDKFNTVMALKGGLVSETIINSDGYLKIDSDRLGIIQMSRYYKDDYEMSYAKTQVSEVDELIYFNCPNSGALTTAIDKMFNYASKLPDNIKTD